MKCDICASRNMVFNETLGENVCAECGYVHMTAPFEREIVVTYDDAGGQRYAQRHSDSRSQLGSFVRKADAVRTKKYPIYRENLRQYSWASRKQRTNTKEVDMKMMMYLSEYNVSNELKERAKTYYRAMYKDDYLRGYSNERKAAGVTYFVLKEAGIVTSLDRHVAITKTDKSYLSKLARKIAKYAKKSYVFAQQTPRELSVSLLGNMEKASPAQRNAVFLFSEYVSRVYEDLNMRFSNNRMGACAWIATTMIGEPLTQTEIVKNWLASDYGIRNNAKEMCNILSLDRKKLSFYDINDVIKGIRVNENENEQKERSNN